MPATGRDVGLWLTCDGTKGVGWYRAGAEYVGGTNIEGYAPSEEGGLSKVRVGASE